MISTPPSVPTTEVTPLLTPVQVAIPQTGVWLRVIYPGNYTGTYGLSAQQTPVTDTGDHFYQIYTINGPFDASIRKQDGYNDKLVVAVYKDGMLIKEESTTIPYYSINFHAEYNKPMTRVPTPQVTTEPTIPNLVGNWTGPVKGYIEGVGYRESSNVNMTLVITEQKNRLFTGYMLFPLLSGTTRTEEFAGVIDRDGKTLRIVEYTSGHCDGTIVSTNEIELINIDNGEPSMLGIDTLKRIS